MLATIGKRAAIIDFGWIRLKGWLAWWVWGVAHIYFLIGLRNRLAVALNWLWIYFSGQRSARLILQDEKPKALQRRSEGRIADMPPNTGRRSN
jgi:NADH dehydrogenase